MCDMRGATHPGKKAAGSVVQLPDSSAPKESSPMLQALTLSTSLTKSEQLTCKLDVGNAPRDGNQSFSSRTLRHIKAAHQLTSSPGIHSARQPGAVQGRTPLTSPGALRNRLRNASSETRKLDVGLRVSAVKVTQLQPVELSQEANGGSPYSSTQADDKGTMKRKGVVKSATFSARSAEAMYSGDERTARSSNRGVRPNTAPAASENYPKTPSDSTKQPPKRRQLAEAPEVPFALPSFRPSTCSTANSPLLRPRQVQRPGTPNPKGDAVIGSAKPGSTAARLRANVRVPTSATSLSRHAEASRHDWALARLAAGKVPGADAWQPVRSAQAFQQLDMDQQLEDTSSSCSSSESSSIVASHEDAADGSQALMEQHTDLGQDAIRVRAGVLRRPSYPNVLGKVSINMDSSPQDIGLGGQGVSSGALSNALKSLGSARQARECQDAPLISCQQRPHAPSHMNGNTVTSCVCDHQDAAAESTVTEAALDDRTVRRMPDPLIGECTQIMQLFGMGDDWFEHEFLPYAHAHHTD